MSTININKDQFVKEHTIDSATTFKQVLYSQAFENFDNTLFSMVYNNSHKVVWKISDRYLFDTISSKDTFMEFIDVIQMQYNEID
ncbi:hypothetical protein GW750_05460 [bacterium]|nr:hypothetical protein [bacterium]